MPARDALVIVLVGPKGSGKSFIGQLASEALGLRFLRVEPIFLEHMRRSRRSGPALEAEGYAKVLAEVDAALRRDPRVVIESTGASEAFPAFLDALRARCAVRLVAVRAPRDLCLARTRTRDRTLHIDVSDARVEEINARAGAVALPWDLEIDNGGPAAPDDLLRALRSVL